MVPAMPTTKPLLGPRAAGAYAVVLALVSAGAALVAAVLLVQGLIRDAADVWVDLSDRVRLDLDDRLDLPEGATLLGNLIPVRLHVPDLPLGLRLLAQSGDVVLFLAIATGALALAQVLRTVRTGRPFARRNPTWLAVVAVAVVAGGILAPVLREAAAVAALEHLGVLSDGSRFTVVTSFSLAPVALAVVILGVAEAFRRGAAMAADVDGLV
ncbi:Protein of unknown function [Blastococcus tunisiensis]|uniref:DUF2975 domain-containing protein n=2 Tax=Blastococcus tunisiensis TaxID=1798228 RepID=A0A1I2M6C5_9ACTN|nr:Protein of unknown function [Blastococcus sp. DSM 46838]